MVTRPGIKLEQNCLQICNFAEAASNPYSNILDQSSLWVDGKHNMWGKVVNYVKIPFFSHCKTFFMNSFFTYISICVTLAILRFVWAKLTLSEHINFEQQSF